MARPRHLWSYSYADLADLLDLSEEALRQAVSRDQFDPGDLESVFAFKARRDGVLGEERRANLRRLAEGDPIAPGGRDRERGSVTAISTSKPLPRAKGKEPKKTPERSS